MSSPSIYCCEFAPAVAFFGCFCGSEIGTVANCTEMLLVDHLVQARPSDGLDFTAHFH